MTIVEKNKTGHNFKFTNVNKHYTVLFNIE